MTLVTCECGFVSPIHYMVMHAMRRHKRRCCGWCGQQFETKEDLSSHVVVHQHDVQPRSSASNGITITGIYEAIMNALPATRGALVSRLAMPSTTIFDYLTDLVGIGAVRKRPLYNEAQVRGRPKIVYEVIP